MKWLDGNWWNGMATVMALQVPEDDSGLFRLLLLQKDQNKVNVLESESSEELKGLETILEKHPKVPIVLCLFGGFAMEKSLPEELSYDPVAGVLGVSVEGEDDFGQMAFPMKGGGSHFALMRREKAEEMVASLGDFQNRVVEVIFSRAVWGSFWPMVKPELLEGNLELRLGEDRFLYTEGELALPEALLGQDFSSLERSDFTEVCPEPYLDLYAACVFLWLNGEGDGKSPFGDVYQNHRKTSLLKNLVVAAAIVVGLWTVALFSLRIQGERQKAELEYTYSLNLPVIKTLGDLDDKIEARQALQSKLGNNVLRPTRMSFYFDRLAAIVPVELGLTLLVAGPEEEDFKLAGMRDEMNWDMIVKGESAESGPVSSFSNLVEQQEWINELRVHRSEINFQTGAYEFVFLIRLEENV